MAPEETKHPGVIEFKPVEDAPGYKDVAPGYNLEYARTILLGLMRKGQTYEGTVSKSVKEKRRARNRAARDSRRRNR
jgi:hypothetical protein